VKAVLLHPNAIPVVVEIASNPLKRAQGLKGRYILPWNTGMLFVFPEAALHRFTMRDTPLSLDLIFLDGEGMVMGIVPHVAPYSNGPYGIGLRCKFVLEVLAGWAKFYGVEPGDIFTYTQL
jgi:uncharacterized membrane protein (UPF0127 family)